MAEDKKVLDDDTAKVISQLAAKITFFRVANNFTQQKLSELTGLSIGTISNMESGSASYNIAQLNNLAMAFGIQIQELFQLLKQMPENPQSTKKTFRIRSKEIEGFSKDLYAYEPIENEKDEKEDGEHISTSSGSIVYNLLIERIAQAIDNKDKAIITELLQLLKISSGDLFFLSLNDNQK